MSSTEKATAASGSPAAAVAVVACSRERPRPRLETMPIRHLRSIRRTSTYEKSHDRGQEQRLALRSSRPSFMKCGSVQPRTHIADPTCTDNKDDNELHPIDRRQKKPPFYLPLAEGGEELVAPGGGSITPTLANASIAIFQVPLSVFSILSQLPWMVLSLTATE
jgi:hypothetical protein